MEIGRPRDDSAVSCDLYTLAVAPSWRLRHFFFFFGGWWKYIGFAGLWFSYHSFFLLVRPIPFFSGGFFPAISLGFG